MIAKTITSAAAKAYKAPKMISTKMPGVDHVLGGGLVPGSIVLCCGPAGDGKTTLLLQIADKLASKQFRVAFVSGRESFRDVLRRCHRLGIFSDDILLSEKREIADVLAEASEFDAKMLIVDDVNAISCAKTDGVAGGKKQLKTVIAHIDDWSRKHKIIAFVVAHMRPDSVPSGNSLYTFDVDLGLFSHSATDDGHLRKLFGARKASELTASDVRTLTTFRNTFGKTGLKSFFLMTEKGLQPLQLKTADVSIE